MKNTQIDVGVRVEQVKVGAPEYAHNIGRKGIVVELFKDEKSNVHVKTDDGIWCPCAFVVAC